MGADYPDQRHFLDFPEQCTDIASTAGRISQHRNILEHNTYTIQLSVTSTWNKLSRVFWSHSDQGVSDKAHDLPSTVYLHHLVLAAQTSDNDLVSGRRMRASWREWGLQSRYGYCGWPSLLVY